MHACRYIRKKKSEKDSERKRGRESEIEKEKRKSDRNTKRMRYLNTEYTRDMCVTSAAKKLSM